MLRSLERIGSGKSPYGGKRFHRFYATMFTFFAAQAELPNLTRNDQYPIFSSFYPYDFLAMRQKANLMRFDYIVCTYSV